jgi:hypothetical protein
VIYMGSILVSTGERITCDDTMTVFVHGAYNLGSVLESRDVSTTALHPGERINHVSTTGGEDSYIISPDASSYSYGIAEIDFGILSDCSADYAITDNIPGIPFHMNPGAYLRNIVCVDPVSSDISPDEPLHTTSGAAGAFIAAHTEFTMATEADNEGWVAGTTSGAVAAHIMNRVHLKQAYFLTDPSAAYDTVAYICSAGY